MPDSGGLTIGGVPVAGRAFLAPMSGITDAPFRAAALSYGTPVVISEMIASGELARQRPSSLKRAMGQAGRSPSIVQLAGREPGPMADAARIAHDLGADIIDINMGCPAKKVTGGLSGAALMREPDRALALFTAVRQAVPLPVTVKMRLGWDDGSITAPALARRLEEAGAAMITVHGRTRCQFYKGSADWTAIAAVKADVNVPVVANGDLTRFDQIEPMLQASGADAVMIGRGAQGRPWFPAAVARYLDTGEVSAAPSPAEECGRVLEHYDAMLVHHGTELGVRCARKHLGWYIEQRIADPDRVRVWRRRLCTEDDPDAVLRGIADLYDDIGERAAA